MIKLIKVREDGSTKPFYCDTVEEADSRIKKFPGVYCMEEDYLKNNVVETSTGIVITSTGETNIDANSLIVKKEHLIDKLFKK